MMKIRENVPINTLTTMRLGGPAQYVAEVTELADIPEALKFAQERKLPVFVLGGGANTIGRDEGFPGVVILMRLSGIEVLSQTADEVVVRAMAGEVWDDLVAFCVERGFSGLELLSKIPGTVGAAPVQNIGAYGQDIAHVIENVEAYDTVSGELVVIGREEMQMEYRSTIFNTGPDAGRYVIVAVTFVLENEASLEPPFYNSLQQYFDENGISDYSPAVVREAVAAVRAAKLPDPAREASAGSFFKNIYFTSDAEAAKAEAEGVKVLTKPDGRKMINSGYLIQAAGLAGRELFGFRVSEKAALVLINESAKSYADLAAARAEIRKIVEAKFGFLLEQEPVEMVAQAPSKDTSESVGDAEEE